MNERRRVYLVVAFLFPLLFLLISAIPESLYPKSLELELDGIKGVSFDNYNRVDGLPLTYGFHAESQSFEFYLKAIYRFANERVGGKGGLTIRPVREPDIAVMLSIYSFSDTQDRWRVGDFENSLSTFFFKEDFRNYYQRQGLTVSIVSDFFDVLRGEARYRIDRYTSLGTVAEMSLFGWAKDFRANPPIEDGWMGSLEFELIHDTRNDVEEPTLGWYQTLRYEISDPALGGDFDFQYMELSLYRFNRIGRGKNLDMKLFAALGSESAPPQRGVHIYGVGGLRGYPDDFSAHYRAFVSTIEARFILPESWQLTPLYRDRIQMLLFADVGGVRSRGPDGLWTLDGDAGIGLEGSGLTTYNGIFLAFDLDDDDIHPRLTFRVRREF
jgi:hypothetical protein